MNEKKVIIIDEPVRFNMDIGLPTLKKKKRVCALENPNVRIF